MRDAICRPFISASRDDQPLGSVWHLECEHDLHITGPFHQLVALAEAHLADQCPVPDEVVTRSIWANVLQAIRA